MRRITLMALLILNACVHSEHKVKADVYLTTPDSKKIGTITFIDTTNGLLVQTDLRNLPQGYHGFHIHEKPSCERSFNEKGKIVLAGSAGAHYDPFFTKQHLGPNGGGHKGDLPVLSVDEKGNAKVSFVQKGLKAGDIKNRSVVIHEHGDNYQDKPKPLGGGGNRIACGVIR